MFTLFPPAYHSAVIAYCLLSLFLLPLSPLAKQPKQSEADENEVFERRPKIDCKRAYHSATINAIHFQHTYYSIHY